MSERQNANNTDTIRALCVAVDAKGYSEREAKGQHRLQADLLDTLNAAAADAGLDRLEWSLQPQGDGELAVLPSDQDERLVVDGFVQRLDARLTVLNEERLPEARLRLRVAMHFGVAVVSANGFSGQAPVLVSRLLASAALHEALADVPEANLALALSESLYEELVLNRLTSLRPDDFGAIEIREDKFQGRAWIRVPVRGSRPPLRAAEPSASAPPPLPLRVEATTTTETVAGRLTGVDAELADQQGAEIRTSMRIGAVEKSGDVTGVKLSTAKTSTFEERR